MHLSDTWRNSQGHTGQTLPRWEQNQPPESGTIIANNSSERLEWTQEWYQILCQAPYTGTAQICWMCCSFCDLFWGSLLLSGVRMEGGALEEYPRGGGFSCLHKGSPGHLETPRKSLSSLCFLELPCRIPCSSSTGWSCRAPGVVTLSLGIL